MAILIFKRFLFMEEEGQLSTMIIPIYAHLEFFFGFHLIGTLLHYTGLYIYFLKFTV